MGKMCKNYKLLYAIAFLIIIAGVIVYFTKGFSLDMKYAKKDQIVLSNHTGFDFSKIKEISKEVFEGKEIEVSEVEIFKNAVAISAPEITEEEKGKIIEKVNQEYGLEITTDKVEIQNIGQVRIKDILKPYILPIILSFAICLFYLLIRYRKLGVKKVLAKCIGLTIFAELIYFSIIEITRVPFGDITIALALLVYASMLVLSSTIFDNEVEDLKEQDLNNK